MSQLLSQLSESIALLVANAAPLLTAIRIGANRHVTGFLWRNELIVTTDRALPAAGSYTIVLSTGALISAHAGPRDPGHNLACLHLDVPVTVALGEPARSATIGALVLALGANFDGSPTVRLTSIHGFPRSPRTGVGAAITLDVAGERVCHGGMVLDSEGRLLGMASATADGEGDCSVTQRHRPIRGGSHGRTGRDRCRSGGFERDLGPGRCAGGQRRPDTRSPR